MKQKKWTRVEAAGDIAQLDAGVYVARIVSVEDKEDEETLHCVFDIAEGENAGVFAASPDWAHDFKRSYSDKSESFFKRFLECVEFSNPQFSIEQWENAGCNPQAFVGMLVGIAWQDYISIPTRGKNAGKEVTRKEVATYFAAQDVRNGDAKLPPVRDARNGKQGTNAQQPKPTENQGGYGAYDDIPFSVQQPQRPMFG